MFKVKLYPGLIRAATQSGNPLARPISLWHLARAIDEKGSGRVDFESLRETALTIWSRDKFYRSIREAEKVGLLRLTRRNPDNAKVIALTSLFKVAQRLGVNFLGTTPVFSTLESLRTATTFKATLFGAFHASRQKGSKHRPISREVIRDLTTVSRSTQLRYENASGVNKRYNYLLLGQPAENLYLAREFEHGACFVWQGQILRPLPNSYSSGMTCAGSRSLKRVNKELGRLLNTGDGLGPRLFYEEPPRRSRIVREQNGIPSAFQHDTRLVLSGQTHNGCGLWKRF